MFNIYITSPGHELSHVMKVLNGHLNHYTIYPATTIKRTDSYDTSIVQVSEPFLGGLLKNVLGPELKKEIKNSKIGFSETKDITMV